LSSPLNWVRKPGGRRGGNPIALGNFLKLASRKRSAGVRFDALILGGADPFAIRVAGCAPFLSDDPGDPRNAHKEQQVLKPSDDPLTLGLHKGEYVIGDGLHRAKTFLVASAPTTIA
jgi:hypothetical protein